MKKLLITGGTSGIGLDFIKAHHENYSDIFVFGRNFDQIKSLDLSHLSYKKVDFSRAPVVDLTEGLPIIDHICICAGYVENNITQFYDSKVTGSIIQTNLVSQIDLLGTLVTKSRIARGGSVVLVGSLLGSFIGMPGGMAYAASKAGLEGAGKVLALELARKLIRVNTICPGMVDTELTSELTVISEAQFEADKKKYPLGKRYAKKQDVVGVIDFLFSERSSFITGETIKIDGGYTVAR